MDKRKLLIDTDPGIDDCFALMCALNSDVFDVLGILCTAGNKSLPVVSANALRIMDFEGCDIPVCKGAKANLKRLEAGEEQENISADCHGSDGMGQSDLPYSERCLLDVPSWDFMLEKIKEYPNEIEVICLGPLTNLALAIAKDKETMKKIKSITIMGGAFFVPGNITPYAEYNIWFDAQAAEIVVNELAEDVDIRIVGIDASNQIVISHGLLDFLSYEGGERGVLLERISRGYIHHYYVLNKAIGAIIHDMYCVMSCIDPSLISEQREVKVKIYGEGEKQGWIEMCEDGKKVTAILGLQERALKRGFLELMMPDKKEIIDEMFEQLV
ncbi:MAG: nucleoside hydrolase [Erysipelotrichales bacterium]|nr:nucleoside hydrolase [Erysipelotrichales bacterium]